MIVGVPITPSSVRGSESETRPGVKPSGRGGVALNLPTLGEPQPVRAWRRSYNRVVKGIQRVVPAITPFFRRAVWYFR
jgi:hypothetical protein